MSQKAADDFNAIRQRLEQLRYERDIKPGYCANGCGAKYGETPHAPGCIYKGTVTLAEIKPEG